MLSLVDKQSQLQGVVEERKAVEMLKGLLHGSVYSISRFLIAGNYVMSPVGQSEYAGVRLLLFFYMHSNNNATHLQFNLTDNPAGRSAVFPNEISQWRELAHHQINGIFCFKTKLSIKLKMCSSSTSTEL